MRGMHLNIVRGYHLGINWYYQVFFDEEVLVCGICSSFAF